MAPVAQTSNLHTFVTIKVASGHADGQGLLQERSIPTTSLRATLATGGVAHGGLAHGGVVSYLCFSFFPHYFC
jgi:hypothetical protein